MKGSEKMVTIFRGKKTGQLVLDGKGTILTSTDGKPCIKVSEPVCIQNFTFVLSNKED